MSSSATENENELLPLVLREKHSDNTEILSITEALESSIEEEFGENEIKVMLMLAEEDKREGLGFRMK